MTGMDWARADIDPDDPGSQGYTPATELTGDEWLRDLQAIKTALIERQQHWVLATARITLLAAELFTPEGVAMWMQRPNSRLGDKVPATLIAAGHADEVEQLLQGLADGVMG